MPNHLTTSITWNGKEFYEFYVKPQFIGKNPFVTEGIKIVPNVQDKLKLNYFTPTNKVLKAYAKGFSGATGATYTQRDLNVYQMKAEFSQDANELYNTVFQELLGKGVDWNNLDAAAPVLKQTLIDMFMNAITADIFRQVWLNDTVKETVTSGKFTGVADVNYNAYDGLWKKFIAVAATTPSATQIKRVAFSHGSVAQIETVSVTGTSGTANVVVNGLTYLASFNGTLTQTNLDFVTLHAAALLLRGIVVTASVADLIFTSAIAGQPFTAPTIANVSGNLAGTVAHTLANTVPAALTTDEAYSTLKDLFENADVLLRQIPANKKVFLVTNDVYNNYINTLEAKTTERGNTMIIDGVEYITYRGVPVVNMNWDVYLGTDFPTAYPSRIVYTAFDNLYLGIDAMSEFSNFEFWYNKDEQENRFRLQTKIGAEYNDNKLVAVAY